MKIWLTHSWTIPLQEPFNNLDALRRVPWLFWQSPFMDLGAHFFDQLWPSMAFPRNESHRLQIWNLRDNFLLLKVLEHKRNVYTSFFVPEYWERSFLLFLPKAISANNAHILVFNSSSKTLLWTLMLTEDLPRVPSSCNAVSLRPGFGSFQLSDKGKPYYFSFVKLPFGIWM